MTQRHRFTLARSLLAAVVLLVPAWPSEAANECKVSYTFMSGSGPSAVPGVEQEEVSANSIEDINQSQMRYVVNDRDWPVEVEVTTVGGGTKWVPLGKKGDRDPAHVNYVGDITLKKVKCLPGGTANASAPAPGGTGAEPMTQMMQMMQMMQSMQMTGEDQRKRAAAHDEHVHQIFANVRAITVPHAETLATWAAQANAVAKKAAEDFAGCPSTVAQAQYDDLKQKRAMTISARDGARAASTQAQQALASCVSQTGNSPSCTSAHAALPFSTTHASAVTALAAIDSALAFLRGLRCISALTNRAVPLVANP